METLGLDPVELGKTLLAALAPVIIEAIKKLSPMIQERIPVAIRWLVWPAVSAILGAIIAAIGGVAAGTGAAVGLAASVGYAAKKIKTQ